MKNNILPAIKLTVICLIFFSGIYTLIVLAIAQLAPNNGKGEIIKHGDQTFYSNVGQSFTDDKYFNSRPSAAGYNAASSCGSNKGPSNPDYLAEVRGRIDTILVHNPDIHKSQIPADLVTASGAGLDPNISVQAANIQVPRIAKIRSTNEDKIYELINQSTEHPLIGMFGPEKINVLKLNIALDNLK